MLQHLSQLGSLPDSAADTHSHYQSRPIYRRPTTPMTSMWGSIVEWAGKQHPPPLVR